MKFCSTCRHMLALTDFHFRRASHDGRQWICKACIKAYQRDRHPRPSRPPGRPKERLKLGLKTCYVCQRTKPLDEFHINSYSADGRQAKCKDCAIAYRKKQYVPKTTDRLAGVKERLRTGLKICPRCKKLKRLTEFHKRSEAPDGVQSLCKPCQINSVLATIDIARARRTAHDWAKAHPRPKKPRKPRVVRSHEEQLEYWRKKWREWRERKRAGAPPRRKPLPTTQEGMRAYWREKRALYKARREAAAKGEN